MLSVWSGAQRGEYDETKRPNCVLVVRGWRNCKKA